MAAALAISIAACAGGAPPTGAPTATAGQPADPDPAANGTEAGLEQAARESFEAFLGADDETYFASLSRECREGLGFAAVESYLIGRRQRATDLGGIDLSAVAVSVVMIDNFSGAGADVRLVLTGTSQPFSESEPHEWQYEEGGWRLDDCSDMRESPNDLTGRGTDADEPLVLGDVLEVGGWFVSLAYVEQDYETVVNEGEVEPAGEGNQLVSAQLLVDYNGAEPSVVVGEHMTFAMVVDSTVFGDEATCRSDLPGLFYDPTGEASPGEDIPRPLICREVPSEVANRLLLRLTHTPTGTDYWFDLEPILNKIP